MPGGVSSGRDSFVTTDTAWAAKGDLLAATANDAGTVLSVGANQDSLWVDTTTPSTGLRWSSGLEPKQYNDLLGSSFDIATSATQQTIVVATQYFCRIPLPVTISVTSLSIYLVTKGTSTVTNGFLALYKSDGTMIGQSADQTTNWASGGTNTLKTLALTGGPFTVIPLAANDFVWGMVYVGAQGGVAPKFLAAIDTQSDGLNVGCTNARSRAATQALASTSTMPSVTPASMTQTTFCWWIGLT